jgi:hypothetical protein
VPWRKGVVAATTSSGALSSGARRCGNHVVGCASLWATTSLAPR